MLPEIVELEPRIKEILYRCMERIRATKAALYLYDPSNAYELATQYGFGEASRRVLLPTDAVIDRLVMRRAPFFVNGVGTEPRFSELLYQSGTDRMLVAPLYSRGKLIGLFDMRDKAGRQPFDQGDLDQAKTISEEMIELLAEKNLYGLQAIALSSDGTEGSLESNTAIMRIIQSAQTIVSRDVTRVRLMNNDTLSQAEVSAVSMVLPSVLSIRGVVMVAFSAFGHLGNAQSIVAKSMVTEETLAKFHAKVAAWRKKRGEEDLEPQTRISYPFGTAGAPLQESQLVSILSAPVDVAGITGMVLSVAFETGTDPEARKQLETFLYQIQHTIEHAISHKVLGVTRHRIAQKLVEPDFQKFPELAAHSKRVATLSEQFAHHLGLSESESDTIRIAAYVHDVGMRLIDYPRLYRKPALTPAEKKLMQEHAVVGAALIEPALGAATAHIVLCHHERVDGKGYPSGMTGEQIPLGSRIIAICDAFDSMTAADSYQPPISEPAAMEKISNAAGAQFDLELVKKFASMMG